MARAGIGDRVEGFHAVAAAVQAGRARSVRIEQRRLKGSAYTGLADAARSAGAEVEFVSDVRAHALTSAPQGVVAACEPKQTVSIEDAVASTQPAALLVFVFWPGPLGARKEIFEAVGADFAPAAACQPAAGGAANSHPRMKARNRPPDPRTVGPGVPAG